MTWHAYRTAEAFRLARGDRRTVAAVGNFDGVHRGHQAILARVIERARSVDALAVAVTFDPHPSKVLRADAAPPLITTVEQRIALLAAAGLDAILLLPFSAEFARLSPGDFASQILLETLQVSAVCVGENFRFGHRQEGDTRRLAELGDRLGFATEIVPSVCQRGVRISSTMVRRAIAEGEIERGGRMLGRPFSLTGEIQPGTGQGRHVVVPTLNLAYEQELLPARGVYATEAVLDEKMYRAATNVGLRPTFGGHTLTVESHLLNFAEERAAGRLEVRFWKRLRDERKFSSVKELRSQVLRDIDRARNFFARLHR